MKTAESEDPPSDHVPVQMTINDCNNNVPNNIGRLAIPFKLRGGQVYQKCSAMLRRGESMGNHKEWKLKGVKLSKFSRAGSVLA